MLAIDLIATSVGNLLDFVSGCKIRARFGEETLIAIKRFERSEARDQISESRDQRPERRKRRGGGQTGLLEGGAEAPWQ